MAGTALAILAPAIVVSTILWSLDSAIRQANPVRAQMNKGISARWAIIVRGCLSRIS
jgi:hypothetical protein